jgi:hypothetical protein
MDQSALCSPRRAMGNRSDVPDSTLEPSVLWRVRQWPGTNEAAQFLFVVLAAMWLEAAATAQVWEHSAPAGYRFPSRSSFYVWIALGVVGVLLAFGSLVGRVWPPRRRRLVVVIACLGTAGEIVLAHLLTGHAVATAPLGFNNSGEAATAIVALAISQLALVGALSLVLGPVLATGSGRAHRLRDRPSWSRLSGPAGMVLACGAFAGWSLCDGTALIVNTSLIAGKSSITNVGAWWPGLFAAMVVLTVVALVCTPGIPPSADVAAGLGPPSSVPRQPSGRSG